VALYFTVRCCLFVFLVPLSTILAVYLLSQLSCMALVSLALSYVATKRVQQFIVTSAPTKQHAKTAVESTRIWVPLVIFLTSVFVMRTLAAITILTPILTWSPALSLAVAIRLALSSILLGLSVVSRFVGSPSVGKYGKSITCIEECLTYEMHYYWPVILLTMSKRLFSLNQSSMLVLATFHQSICSIPPTGILSRSHLD
jgi:hypothetical protein